MFGISYAFALCMQLHNKCDYSPKARGGRIGGFEGGECGGRPPRVSRVMPRNVPSRIEMQMTTDADVALGGADAGTAI